MPNIEIRLNPFVYISETDIRFYLLILTAVLLPVFWIFFYGFTIVTFESDIFELESRYLLRFFIIAVLASVFPAVIYWRYSQEPKRIIKKMQLKKLDREKYPEECQSIDKILTETSVNNRIIWMYHPFDPSESAFTFGTTEVSYICLSGGLLTRTFTDDIESFKSIIRHELGHIINGDVPKAYLAVSASQILLTLIILPVAMIAAFGVLVVLGTIHGEGFTLLVSAVKPSSLLTYLNVLLYFLIFLTIIYLLRNQIIRVREFYADARVYDWGFSDNLIITLKKYTGLKSQFDILGKFHPEPEKRIEALKNNSGLFAQNLLVAFTAGFFYNLFPFFIFSLIIDYIFVGFFTHPDYGLRQVFGLVFIIDLISITFLMVAISSTFHRTLLKDIFTNHHRFFSLATVTDAITFSLTFGLGVQMSVLLTGVIIVLTTNIDRMEENLMGIFLNIIPYATSMFISLFFLMIFASLSIQTSYSKKDAMKNFFLFTCLSSILYIFNDLIAAHLFYNQLLGVVFFLFFSLIACVIIMNMRRNLHCPHCNEKLNNQNPLELSCPKCKKRLFSWAIYASLLNSV